MSEHPPRSRWKEARDRAKAQIEAQEKEALVAAPITEEPIAVEESPASAEESSGDPEYDKRVAALNERFENTWIRSNPRFKGQFELPDEYYEIRAENAAAASAGDVEAGKRALAKMEAFLDRQDALLSEKEEIKEEASVVSDTRAENHAALKDAIAAFSLATAQEAGKNGGDLEADIHAMPKPPEGKGEALAEAVGEAAENGPEDAGEHSLQSEEALRPYLAGCNERLDTKAEMLGIEKGLRRLGEKYGKLGWKSKIAVGAALGIGAASLSGVSALGYAACVGLLATQRIAGASSMFLKFEKNLKEIAEDKAEGLKIFGWNLFGKESWYQKAVRRMELSEKGQRNMAIAMSMAYTGGMSAAIGEAVHLASESSWGDAVHEFLKHHWPFGTTEAPATAPVVPDMNIQQNGEIDQWLHQNIDSATANMDHPVLEMSEIPTPPVHIPEMPTSAVHLGDAASAHLPGAEAVHHAPHPHAGAHHLHHAAPHGHEVPPPAHTPSVVKIEHSGASVETAQPMSAEDAYGYAVDEHHIDHPFYKHGSPGLEDQPAAPIEDHSAVAHPADAIDSQIGEPGQGFEFGSHPAPGHVASVPEHVAPIEDHSTIAQHIPAEHAALSIDPSHAHIFQDAGGKVIAMGNNHAEVLSAAQEFAKAHPNTSVWVQADKPVMIGGAARPYVFEVRYGGWWRGMQIIGADAPVDTAHIGGIKPDTFIKQLDK